MRQVPIIIQKQTKLYLVLNYCKHNLKENYSCIFQLLHFGQINILCSLAE